MSERVDFQSHDDTVQVYRRRGELAESIRHSIITCTTLELMFVIIPSSHSHETKVIFAKVNRTKAEVLYVENNVPLNISAL